MTDNKANRFLVIALRLHAGQEFHTSKDCDVQVTGRPRIGNISNAHERGARTGLEAESLCAWPDTGQEKVERVRPQQGTVDTTNESPCPGGFTGAPEQIEELVHESAALR